MPTYEFSNLAPNTAVSITDADDETVDEGTTNSSGVYSAELDAGVYTATTLSRTFHATATGTPVPSDGDVPTYSEAAGGYVPSVGGGGGVEVVRKRLAYDFDYTLDPDPDNFYAGVTITTEPLLEGTVIEDAWVMLRDPESGSAVFTAGQAYMGLYVNAVPVASPGDYDDFLYYDISNQTAGQVVRPAIREVGTADVSRSMPCVVLGDDCHLAIHLESDTPFTAGTATLFVLYSEPA